MRPRLERTESNAEAEPPAGGSSGEGGPGDPSSREAPRRRPSTRRFVPSGEALAGNRAETRWGGGAGKSRAGGSSARGRDGTGLPRTLLARFDDWAIGLSAGVLTWICVYYLYFLLTPAWLGEEDQVEKLKWTAGLFLGYRGLLFLVDSLRGRGAVLTRMPGLAFIDMLALGAMVVESWDENLESLLAPLFIVFLALVPILYRNIQDRRLYIAFSVALALEATLLIIPASTAELRNRYQRNLEKVEDLQIQLRALPGTTAPPPHFGEELEEMLTQIPHLVNPVTLTFAREMDEHAQTAELINEDAEVAIRHTLTDLDRAVRRVEDYRVELDGKRDAVSELLAEVEAVGNRQLEDVLLTLEGFEEPRRAFHERFETVRSALVSIDRRLAEAQLRLEIRYHERLTDQRRVVVESYGIWMPIVLGFLVQFQIRRFVNRRIDTERSRTLSEMLSERHRMDAQNWINLTAGLTHNIGNEVRGYDVFLEEILEWIEEGRLTVTPEVHERLQFIYGTNQARLGFIQFLREFALLKQVYEDERPVPGGLRPIRMERAIRAAHARVQSIETSYNPADSTDPGDIRKRKKFLGTELDIEWVGTGKPITLKRGREAVLDFFFYELLKNALRNCSGRFPLTVTVQRVSLNGTVEVCFINDLMVDPAPAGECQRCGEACEERVVMAVYGKEALCSGCLRAQVEDRLDTCFYPGRGSGTGLGLFVIKHFLEEYYYGFIHCGIESWNDELSRYLVYFRLVVPDDLAAAIREKNALWRATI